MWEQKFYYFALKKVWILSKKMVEFLKDNDIKDVNIGKDGPRYHENRIWKDPTYSHSLRNNDHNKFIGYCLRCSLLWHGMLLKMLSKHVYS